MDDIKKVSYAQAQSVLKRFRYKPRNQWSEKDRLIFKICNFTVLSKKRLNNVMQSLKSLSKLSDKSHYKYSDLDIKLIKELILENLETCFESFNQNINIMKESDIQQVGEHLQKLNDENLRLENENKRLNFIIESFIRESEIKEIRGVREILKKKLNKRTKNKRSSTNQGLIFNKDNLKDLLDMWNKGLTTSEITNRFKKVDVDLSETKKRRFKL